MIYYPLSVLMRAGLREILIISTERDLSCYEELLGDGSDIGLGIKYAVQAASNGLAEAFIIDDNIFYGYGFSERLKNAVEREKTTIFGYHVSNPKEFGVVEYSNYAV